jgi:hypothetical protein
MWHNLQTQHCILLLVNQPGINAAAVFSSQECRKYLHLATCQLPQDYQFRGGIMEVFQNSPEPLNFTAFVIVNVLALAPVSLHVPLHLICG